MTSGISLQSNYCIDHDVPWFVVLCPALWRQVYFCAIPYAVRMSLLIFVPDPGYMVTVQIYPIIV